MNKIWQNLQLTATFLALAPLAAAQNATTAPQTDSAVATPTQFARVTKDDDGRPSALQLAIVTYVPRDHATGYSVDLVSAIHIGDRSYYADLNDRFRDYDVLLYELVAPEGKLVAPEDSDGKGIFSSVQNMIGNMLDLSFQLDQIDYSAANFVHADLSPEELRQSMSDRDESLYVYFWRLYFTSVKQYAKDPLGVNEMGTVASMLASGHGYDLKTLFAYELTKINEAGDFLGGDSGSAVISARNERAMEILRLQLISGKKHVGIFYGVAHLPDMEQYLLNEFGLVHHETAWIDAWQL